MKQEQVGTLTIETPLIERIGFVAPIWFAVMTLIVMGQVLFSDGSRIASKVGQDYMVAGVPFRTFAFEQMKQGNLPLWNPHLFCGTPFIGNFVSTVLYPVNWLHLVLPMGHAINWGTAIHYFLVGLFTSFWCAGRGLSVLACLLAGTTFALSGAFVMHVYAGHPSLTGALAWIPLIFLVTDRLFEKITLGWVLAGAFAVAMTIYTGHPQLVYYTGLAVGLYIVLRLCAQPRRWPVLAALAAIYAGAVALSAVQLLPQLEAISESSRTAGTSPLFASIGNMPPESLVTFIAPSFFGPNAKYWSFQRSIFWETSLFCGVVALLLAGYGAIIGPRQKRRFAIVMIAVAFVLALGSYTPLFELMRKCVPGYQSQRGTGRWNAIVALHVSMLAGIGFDAMRQRLIWPKVLAVIALSLGTLISITAVWLWSTQSGRGAWQWFFSVYPYTAKVTLPADFLDATAVKAASQLVIAGATLLLLGTCLWLMRFSRAWAYAVVVVAVAEMFVFAMSNSPTTPLYQAFPQNWQNILSKLDREDRVLSSTDGYLNESMLLGFDDVYGYDAFVSKRYWEFVRAAMGFPKTTEYTMLPMAKLPVSFRMLRCHAAFYAGANRAASVAVLPDPLPRLVLVPQYEVVTDTDLRLVKLNVDGFDARRTVLLEQEPSPQPQRGATGTASITRADTDELEIVADVNAPTILLVTDAYSKGWRARAYGDSAQQQYQVMPANHMLRAIPLSAGKHHLLLEYSPLGFRVGKWLTLVSIGAFVAASGYTWRDQLKRLVGRRVTHE